MEHISTRLIKSLKPLGLSEYEAKVYSALVLFDTAEAKELVEFLDISKPSVYESLQALEDLGLILPVKMRPAIYRAVEPDMAVRLLLDRQVASAETALEELKELENAQVTSRHGDRLWSIYGRANLEYKLREMIRNAKHSVYCTMSDHYLSYLESISGKGLTLELVVLSDDPETEPRLKKQFRNDRLDLKVISIGALVNSEYADKELKKIAADLDVDNLIELIVDGEEMLTIPPLKGNEVSGLHTSNRALISFSRLDEKFLWEGIEQLARAPGKKTKRRG